MEELESMTTTDLESMARQVANILKSRQAKARNEAIASIEALAEQAGLKVSVHEPAPAGARKTGPAPPRFRHPDDPQKTWSGHGRVPRWLAELERAGRKRTEFAIAA